MLIAIFSLILVKAEVHLLPGQGCKALERAGGALSVDTQGSFLITLDLGMNIPRKFLNSYQKEKDANGQHCLKEISLRLNMSLAKFKFDMNVYLHENDLLKMYLTSDDFLGKIRRGTGAIIFAILISIANVFATTMNIFMSYTQIQNFDHRLSLMSDRFTHIESNQFIDAAIASL